MPKDTTQVLVGVVQMFIAPDGTAQPTDPTTTPASAYVDVGYSAEGWDLTSDVKVAEVDVAELLDPIDVPPTGRETHLVGQAAQATIDNLAIAVGGGTVTTVTGPPAYRQFDGPQSTDLTHYTLLLRGKAPPVAGVAKTREIWVPHAVPTSNVQMRHRKAPDKTLIAMDFRIIVATGTPPYRVRDLT